LYSLVLSIDYLAIPFTRTATMLNPYAPFSICPSDSCGFLRCRETRTRVYVLNCRVWIEPGRKYRGKAIGRPWEFQILPGRPLSEVQGEIGNHGWVSEHTPDATVRNPRSEPTQARVWVPTPRMPTGTHSGTDVGSALSEPTPELASDAGTQARHPHRKSHFPNPHRNPHFRNPQSFGICSEPTPEPTEPTAVILRRTEDPVPLYGFRRGFGRFRRKPHLRRTVGSAWEAKPTVFCDGHDWRKPTEPTVGSDTRLPRPEPAPG
jgi:hypothetical protein